MAEEFDKIFAESSHPNAHEEAAAERAAIERASKALLAGLKPVHPLAAPWALALTFLLLFTAVAICAAWALGLGGIQALNPYQRAAIFPTLLIAAWLTAVASAREMRPAGGFRLGWWALTFSLVVFPIAVSLVFHNYSTQDFVPEGLPCLLLGLRVAIPAGLAIAWIMRRGFVLEWSAAGLTAGALSGLAGLAMLELHCPNPKAIHVMVWHGAVVLVGAALGFALGLVADHVRRAKRV